MSQPRIVIIDDQDGQYMGAQVQAILQLERGYRTDLLAGTPADMMAGFATSPDLIILILPVSKERGAQLLAMLRRQTADTPVLPVMQAVDVHPMLHDLFPGIANVLILPVQATDVCAQVERLLPVSRESARGRGNAPRSDTCGLDSMIGEDPAFLALKRKLPLLAQYEAPVLLTGETGTGKELCARALHYLSRRAGKPFLPVNCGAIPVELFERELFGHAKGAFTGAWAAQPGMIAEVEGGTLFLDEIETLSLNAQVKLLRFLQDHTYYPLGSPHQKQADVWILAATNVELPHKVSEGTFREDLFYRLAVMTLTLPPLRERPLDIPLLAAQLLARYTKQLRGEPQQWSPLAMEALCHYSWPGNIRELENVIQQAAVLTDARTIEPEHLTIPPSLPVHNSHGDSFQIAKAKVIEQFERDYVTELLRVYHGNVTHAARAAQMERRAFGRLIKKYLITKCLPSRPLPASLPKVDRFRWNAPLRNHEMLTIPTSARISS